MGKSVTEIEIDSFELEFIYQCVKYVHVDAMDILTKQYMKEENYSYEELDSAEHIACTTDILLDKLEKYIA